MSQGADTRERLRAAIRANLKDPGARLVWGDYLQQHSEAEVGELVMGSADQAAAYLERTVQLPAMQGDWWHGSLRGARFAGLESVQILTPGLRALAASPVGYFLESLELQLAPSVEPHHVVAVLSDGVFPCLVNLKVEGGQAGFYEHLWPAVPWLHTLWLSAAKSLGLVALERLSSLTLQKVTDSQLDLLTTSVLTSLEQVELGVSSKVSAVAVMQFIWSLPHLRSLWLRGDGVTDALCQQLALWPRASALFSLRLTEGTMTSVGKRAIERVCSNAVVTAKKA